MVTQGVDSLVSGRRPENIATVFQSPCIIGTNLPFTALSSMYSYNQNERIVLV